MHSAMARCAQASCCAAGPPETVDVRARGRATVRALRYVVGVHSLRARHRRHPLARVTIPRRSPVFVVLRTLGGSE